MTLRTTAFLALLTFLFAGCAPTTVEPPTKPKHHGKPSLESPPRGQFGLSMLSTTDGNTLPIEAFQENAECGYCHERQLAELEGSMHNIAHTDVLYRATAELARKEAGEEVYAYCSVCHSPQGVSAGLIPGTPEESLPDIAKQGILCDVCHQVDSLSGAHGPWGEPGNASLVLNPDEDRKFGPPTGDDDEAAHTVETREFLASSEFCASCHTIVHPLNGLRIEHTYDEWKKSIYAENNIQCQDCHMRSVEDAITVAETLKPVKVMGTSVEDGEEREIYPHIFVGGNINAHVLGGSEDKAKIAEARLKSAARIEIECATTARPGSALPFKVSVTNVAAGHNLPTSLTELREIWVDITLADANGRVLFRSGELLADGSLPDDAMWFGARAGDKEGNLTYKPWEITHFLYKRLIPPKGTESDSFTASIPADAKGPLTLSASLHYRSAPPPVARTLIGDKADEMRSVEMTSASLTVEVKPK